MIKVVKLNSDAVLELLGEWVTDNFEVIMKDKNVTDKTLDFCLDKDGQFLCICQDDEDYVELSNDDKQEIIKKIPITTNSMFSNKTKFNKLTKEELLQIISKY